MSFSPRRTLAMARKEWKHILRDPSTLGFALVMPVLLLLLFGYAVSFDVDHVATAVVDEDGSAESRGLLQHLFAGPTFVRVREVARAEEAEALFRRGQASVVVTIPRGFAKAVGRGDEAPVQVLVDAADNSTATSVLSYTTRFASRQNESLAERALAERGMTLPPPAVEVQTRALYNPALRSALFLVPGLMALILSMMAVLLTALTVAREWERGSMEQLFATPVSRAEIVLGKLLPYSALAFTQLLLVLTGSAWFFALPMRGSVPLLLGVAALFLVAMLAQGLVISVVTRSQMVATQVGAASSILPSMLLSGFIVPIDNMPAPLQLLTRLIPARYFVHAARGILLRGAGASTVAGDALALAAFAAALLTLGLLRFPRRVA